MLWGAHNLYYKHFIFIESKFLKQQFVHLSIDNLSSNKDYFNNSKTNKQTKVAACQLKITGLYALTLIFVGLCH